MLLGKAIEDVDQLGEALGLLGFTLGDPFGDALLDVEPEDGQADAVERRLGGRELLQNVHAEPRLLNHAADAAHLSLDAVQARDERLLLCLIQHESPAKRRSPALTIRAGGAIDTRMEMNEHSFMTVAARRHRAAPRLEKVDKRDLILRAAIDTFAARGFFTAQVADVARAAGVAAGTVYLYFRGKDDLLISIFERTMKEAIAEGRESVRGAAEPVERLRAIARLHLDRMSRDRALAVVFQVELRQSTKFMERFSATHLREYLGVIRDVIADGQAKGTFRRSVNPTLAAKLFFGALDEMATNWILSRRKYSLVSEADAIVDVFVGGLGKAP
jgi:TetR/AcrR family fatty acid metabolism transcriptional regulator